MFIAGIFLSMPIDILPLDLTENFLHAAILYFIGNDLYHPVAGANAGGECCV